MEKIKLTNIEVKTDKDKVNPILTTTFIPEDCKGVSLDVDYLTPGETIKYVKMENGVESVDFRKLFMDKVKYIHDLIVEVTKVNPDGTKTPMEVKIRYPEELLAYPSVALFNKIVIATGVFLMSSGHLTEEEKLDLK